MRREKSHGLAVLGHRQVSLHSEAPAMPQPTLATVTSSSRSSQTMRLPHLATSTRTATSRLGLISSHLPSPARAMASSAPAPVLPTFTPSPVPANPLGEGKFVTKAGCLIIGDEVLNGKTKDSNSNYFAKLCVA